MTVALLDTDIIAFKAAMVSTSKINWGGGDTTMTGNLTQAIDAAEFLIDKWRSRSKASTYFCCLGGGTNFRKGLSPDYKANRTTEPPKILFDVYAHIREHHPILSIDGMETDDVMGIYATNATFDSAIIVSTDKDMQSIPALYLNPDKATKPIKISPAAANRFWLTQTLTGDVTDGYKGCPRIGPVKAGEILDGASSLAEAWERVVAAFERAGLTEQDAILNAQLARILRASDWNPTTQEITVWHPTMSIVLPTTPSSETSNPSTTSSKSAETTPATKRRRSATSSSTSVALPSKGRRRKTSGKPAGTSTD